MGIIWDMIQTLRHKSKVVFKRVLPRTCIFGKPSGMSLLTEISGSNEKTSSSTRSPPEKITRESMLCNFPRSYVKFGRKIAEGGQVTIYEALLTLPSFDFKQDMSLVIKKFKAIPVVSQGHSPLQPVNDAFLFVCKTVGYFFDDDNSLCMIMHRFSGDLRDLIDSQMESSQH